jgi:hypothetical protein
MADTVFDALVDDKSFSETCNFLRSHAIRHDQQVKEKNTRHIHNTCQPTGTTKKDKVKTVLELINELQLQDSTGSDAEIDISASAKTIFQGWCHVFPQLPLKHMLEWKYCGCYKDKEALLKKQQSF